MALLPTMSPSKPRSYSRCNVSYSHNSDSSRLFINRASLYHLFGGKTMPSECVPQQFLASKTPPRARILKKPFFSVCAIAKWFAVQCRNTPKHYRLSQRLTKSPMVQNALTIHSLAPWIALYVCRVAGKNTPTVSQARLHNKRKVKSLFSHHMLQRSNVQK